MARPSHFQVGVQEVTGLQERRSTDLQEVPGASGGSTIATEMLKEWGIGCHSG